MKRHFPGNTKEEEEAGKMAEKNSTDQTGETNVDKNATPGGSMMKVTVKTPNGKEEIAISEDSSVAQVR